MIFFLSIWSAAFCRILSLFILHFHFQFKIKWVFWDIWHVPGILPLIIRYHYRLAIPPWYGVIAGFCIDFIWIFLKCCFIPHNPLSHIGRLFIKTHLFIRSTIKCDHFEWFNAFESCKKRSKKTLGYFKVHI